MREMPRITSAMLVVTHECNLRCRYCFVNKCSELMTLDTARAAASFLIANACAAGGITPEINFFGGEPMLMYDSIIVPLVSWVHDELKEPFRFSITTNGTLLTDERIRFMKRHGFGMLLSMDGTAPVQDFNRPDSAGRGTFERLRNIVPKVIAAWPGTTFRMTAIPQTCSHTFESIMWAAAQGFKSFFVVPNVFEHWDDDARARLSDEMGKYARYYAKCRENGSTPILFSDFERAFTDIDAIAAAEARGLYRQSPKCRADGKCGLGSSRFASIHPGGEIYACQELTSEPGENNPFLIGSIFSGVDNQRRRALIDAFNALPVTGEYCDCGCEYDRICDGGCVANNYLVHASLNRLPEMFCWWRRELLHQAMTIKEVRYAEHRDKRI